MEETETVQISQLQADLDRETVVHSSREEELERPRRELEKKSS